MLELYSGTLYSNVHRVLGHGYHHIYPSIVAIDKSTLFAVAVVVMSVQQSMDPSVLLEIRWARGGNVLALIGHGGRADHHARTLFTYTTTGSTYITVLAMRIHLKFPEFFPPDFTRAPSRVLSRSTRTSACTWIGSESCD
jgi:hypothetical protein